MPPAASVGTTRAETYIKTPVFKTQTYKMTPIKLIIDTDPGVGK
jgi:hypothetical protein